MRFGMIGTGGIAPAHLDAFTEHPDRVRLVATCDVDEAAARTLAEKAPDPSAVAVFADHREMIRQAKPDAVIVATPHHLHFPQARDCVEAGIPVLVEKPVVCSLAEMRQLRDLSDRRRVPVMAAQTRRFSREANWVRRWVAADPHNFGALRTFDLAAWQNVFSFTRGPENTSHWILDGRRAGGGVVISVAVHRIDVVRFLTGRNYSEVTARGRFDPPFVNGAESSATALLVMDNGAGGVLHANYLAPRVPYCEAMTLYGESGTIIQHVEQRGQYEGPYAVATTRGRTTSHWHHQYESFQPIHPEQVKDMDAWPFTNQILAFVAAVEAGQAPPSDLHENFNTIACVQAIFDSLRSGRTETVATD